MLGWELLCILILLGCHTRVRQHEERNVTSMRMYIYRDRGDLLRVDFVCDYPLRDDGCRSMVDFFGGYGDWNYKPIHEPYRYLCRWIAAELWPNCGRNLV